MAMTINLRNNSTFFIKVNGIDEVIVPNTPLQDKTIQWISNDTKQISVFSTSACTAPAICQGSLTFQTNVGIFVERGPITGTQSIKLQSDITSSNISMTQVDNDSGGKLIDWSDIDETKAINLSFFNI